ncbi:protein ALP1-like, partial [Aphis craccivora]
FLATGDSYQTIAFSFRLGHSTVHSIVVEVCTAIIKQLLKEYIPEPKKENWEQISNDFWEIWNFPNCIGALDVLLALVDAHYNFIAVDIEAYGKNSDGGIFSNSNFGKALERKKLNISDGKPLPGTNERTPFTMIGDEAFPLKKYLLRPYLGPQMYADNNKTKFNDRLSRARKLLEDTLGQLTQQFRIYSRRMKILPKNADKIIMTTFILHNFIKKLGNIGNSTQLSNSILINTVHNITQIPRQGGSANRDAFEVRDKVKDFICSPLG